MEEKTYNEQWEDVAKTEDAHKAIATTYYQNEKYYNLSGITTLNQFLVFIDNEYKDNCQDLTVLEIGCGTGRETKYLSDCFKEVIAVDASETMVEKGKKRVTSDNVRWYANKSGDLSEVADNSVDVVYSFIVFQHCKFDTVKEYYKEVQRVLKSGGKFTFQLGVFDMDVEPISYGDVGKRTIKTLRQDLTEAGFKIDNIANNHFELHICTK